MSRIIFLSNEKLVIKFKMSLTYSQGRGKDGARVQIAPSIFRKVGAKLKIAPSIFRRLHPSILGIIH